MQPFSIPKQAFSPSGALPHQTNVIHAHSSGFLISALVKSRAAIHVHSPARSAILSAVGLLRAPARDPPAVLMPLAEATRRVADATCFFSMFALLSLPRCGPPPFLTTVAALPPDSLVQNCSLAFQLLVASATPRLKWPVDFIFASCGYYTSALLLCGRHSPICFLAAATVPFPQQPFSMRCFFIGLRKLRHPCPGLDELAGELA
eukprot:GGOE01011568.1.p1 GENE.GGOE01011568.1~~GGOE01011568.1.p1  ORF type:complete len:205 (-),score=1.75 GGOE01011568.1:526-1140(-)